MSVIERERRSLALHRATLCGGSVLPPPKESETTFLHGFFMPFTLIAATLRDAQLRGPYLRVAALRTVVLVLIAGVSVANGAVSKHASKPTTQGVVIRSKKHPDGDGGAKVEPVHVHVPGFDLDIDPDHDQKKMSVFGQDVPVAKGDDEEEVAAPAHASEPPRPPKPATAAAKVWAEVRERWAWLLALFAFLSAIEGLIVFFSRRWDDWLSFHVSRLAQVRPEDDTPKTPGLGFDLKWAYRKGKRRIRGYVVFAAGVPTLVPLRLVPTVGGILFTIALTLWGWYWLGIFSASKSAHAWADEATAPSPLPIRALASRVTRGALVAPLRWYAQLWARLTRSVNPAAATFERSMPAFLGLALARAILALPGFYFFARPIVPVAAGRLCAESDPADRFTARPVDSLALAAHPHDAAPQR